MAGLKLEKAIKKGYSIMDNRYAMTIPQIDELKKKNIVDAIADSFALGYYQGTKVANLKRKGI